VGGVVSTVIELAAPGCPTQLLRASSTSYFQMPSGTDVSPHTTGVLVPGDEQGVSDWKTSAVVSLRTTYAVSVWLPEAADVACRGNCTVTLLDPTLTLEEASDEIAGPTGNVSPFASA